MRGPSPKMDSLTSAAFLLLLVAATVNGAGKDEFCDSTSQCSDTGLTCSGHRCVCLLDIGRKAAQTWACNAAADCFSINAIAKMTLETTDLKIARDPVCTTSSVCPNLPGTVGYCDILMAARR